jgi:hypothetical protein
MIKNDDIQEKKILELLYSKAPNSLSYDLIVETSTLSKEDTDAALERLVEKRILVNDFSQTNRQKIVKPITERRKSYYVKDFPETYPIQEHIRVGNKLIPRLIDGDKARAEDLNSIIEAVVDYTNGIDREIEKRVQEETAKVYKQMIGIFGIFVSIFAIIVISTEKMLRFSPEILRNDWWWLFGQSIALFLPVGLVVGGLVLALSVITRR